ncbi:hypothetical protein MPSEU_000689200 [Mayamaea pseudoterrestris]|nr:hypothetical protein MPSEU_000689200 [Mayamaea pseudoterrestris]
MVAYALVDNSKASDVDRIDCEPNADALDEEDKEVGEQLDPADSKGFLFKLSANGTFDKSSPSLEASCHDDKQNPRAALEKQTRNLQLALAPVLLLLVTLIGIALYSYASFQSNASSYGNNRQESPACGLGEALFPEYKALNMDEALGLDKHNVSSLTISLSKDGTILAIVAPEWNNSVQLTRKLGSRKQVSTYFDVPLNATITSMTLSGDGTHIVAGGDSHTVLVDLKKQAQVTFEDIIANRNISATFFQERFIVSDVAMNHDATRFAVAYGTNDTHGGVYGRPDERGEWEWDNMTSAKVVVFERNASNIWHSTEGGTTYQTDNFGLQLAMSNDADRIFLSTEHDNKKHQMNFMFIDNGRWGGGGDFFSLVRNKQCNNARSDVAASKDGISVIVAVQCWNEGNDGFVYVYPLVEDPAAEIDWDAPYSVNFGFNLGYYKWNRKIKHLTHDLGTNSLQPMSVIMSGDAALTILAIDGVILSRFDGDVATLTADSERSVPVSTGTALSIAISDDASVIVLATTDAKTGGSVCVLKRKRRWF